MQTTTENEILTPLQIARKDANRQFYRAGNALKNALLNSGAKQYVKGQKTRQK